MNFSQALSLACQEQKIARTGWNGKGLFVTAQYPTPDSKMGNPYLYINAVALGGECNPWIPSQTDLFANDWHTTTEPVINGLNMDQITAVVSLIDHEIEKNLGTGDGAYNTYWDNIKASLQEKGKS